ncbi:MAG: hypothetical protein ABIQ95_16900, partial [Bdellovibrionia bacterium]
GKTNVIKGVNDNVTGFVEAVLLPTGGGISTYLGGKNFDKDFKDCMDRRQAAVKAPAASPRLTPASNLK